jgi:hypothetical protein
MASILYGGITYIQVRHAIYCKRCEDTIESTYQHDFKYCSCGAVGIDGGVSAGNRLLGNLSDMEPRSMYRATINTKRFWLPQERIEEHFRLMIAASQVAK